tara:strand:+ start:765 stop:977 length:213 start_codon:yes stop_codon:yes gene_type:complete
MASQRGVIMKAILAHAHGEIEMCRANIEVYLNASVGIGEHTDITGAVMAELDKMAQYEAQIEVLDKYFKA